MLGFLATGTTGLDMTVIDEVVEVTKTVISLFTIFPLNIFLGASILGIGITIFSALRHSA